MNQNSKNIKHKVHEEMEKITSTIVKKGLESILVTNPIMHMRKWDYSEENEQYECWTVAIDQKTDTSIIFSDYGHGGWGLVSTKEFFFGMDSSWFNDLQSCYLDSFAACELRIWCVKKETENNQRITLTKEMKMESAFDEMTKISKKDKLGKYHVEIK